ncbi:MAG TPA: copper chaperone PCu(A)C [Candidatus Corynebacterium avicola]|uniref:Copper chaperone PCu(A)C n=1 Tax=Candidatus Corynebacterium avicola TaxID=2838527 RepID=A0A9D1UL15_9CORY|nr:copper chaperone PCu(A)C [Candidatus Corynebacterium avicola]
MSRRIPAALVAATLCLGVASCGDDSDAGSAEDTATSDAGAEVSDGDLVLEEGYVGAKDADTEMTAVFGELTNTTDEDIHLTRAEGDLEGVYEFHETVDGMMRQTEDGMVIPANGSTMLEPGGDHIMIMENSDEIAAGDVLNLTLTAEDGSTFELEDIPVRVQQSAHEDYAGDDAEDGAAEDGTDDHSGH